MKKINAKGASSKERTPKVSLMRSQGTNLRRDSINPEILRRVGSPARLSSTDALPIACFRPDGGDRDVLLYTGADNTLYYTAAPHGSPAPVPFTPVKLGTLPAPPIMVLADTPGVVRLLLRHAPDQFVTYDSSLNLQLVGAMVPLPEIRLIAAEFNTLSEKVGAVGLSGNSPAAAGGQLNRGDALELSKVLTASYENLRTRAHNLNYCLQPVAARYRLLDSGGNTVAVGPQVILAAPAGATCTDGISQTAGEGMAWLNEGVMQATVFRPALIVPRRIPAPWDKLINKLVVEITDEIEPLAEGLPAPHGMLRDNASGQVTIVSKLPGFANGTVTDVNRIARLGTDALGKPLHVVAEYNNPFSASLGAPGEVVVAGRNPLYNNLPAEKSSAPDVLQAISRTFSAALRDGDTLVLGNPRYETFRGWAPDCFVSASHTSGEEGSAGDEWRLSIATEIATSMGSHTVYREVTGHHDGPRTLGPALTFPSADAVKMTVEYATIDGKYYRRTFPLRPLPEAGLAVYVSTGLEAIQFREEDAVSGYTPELGDEPVEHYGQGMAEIYSVGDLRHRLFARQLSSGEIHAFKVVPRGESGWNFARRKLLFFGEEGTGVCNLGSDGNFHSVAPVDRRPVLSPQAVCEATGSAGAMLLSMAGEDLLGTGGTKISTLRSLFGELPDYSAVAVGFCDCYGEAWLACGDTLLRVSHDGELFSASLPGISGPFRFRQWKGALLLGCPSGVYNLSDEQEDDYMPVKWHRRMRVEGEPRHITLNLFDAEITGTFTLSGDRGTEVPEQLLKLTVDGALNEPVRLRLGMPARQYLEAVYDFTASPAMALMPELFS